MLVESYSELMFGASVFDSYQNKQKSTKHIKTDNFTKKLKFYINIVVLINVYSYFEKSLEIDYWIDNLQSG